jgi:undecaprenyl-diphosphatase
MIFAPWIVALIMGLVEGATEFLPISSTGHLIVAGEWLRFEGDRAATFEVVIQVGAILAVCWHYRSTLAALVLRLFRPGPERALTRNLILAFLPAAVIGVLLIGWIKAHLFSSSVVAIALIVGGIIMLALEWRRPRITANVLAEITPTQALGIGFAQVLAVIPGTSRAAATILGGYAFGLSRPAATEFSFLLAIPTIVGAATLDMIKSRDLFTLADVPMFAVGIVVSFLAALVVIRGFIRYVERHSFNAFAWYRIAFGVGLLIWLSGSAH